MHEEKFEIQSRTPFSESLIWQLNRDFYQEQGIKAWSQGIVPHQMTSNSQVGKTYAELIFAFLKDLSEKGSTKEVVYLLELGAGHGRLAYHILKHLEVLIDSTKENLPKYCYVISDIGEDNLTFFKDHPQFKTYFENGTLDYAYFDAIGSNELQLRYSKKTILPNSLAQPILAIANYFFDSIPNDLYFIKDKEISSCLVSIDSIIDPKIMNTVDTLKIMDLHYHQELVVAPPYEEADINSILEGYRALNTYLFFPRQSITCLQNVQALSQQGLVLLTMDKGFHELQKLNNKPKPDIIAHGSFSLWANYHALNNYCLNKGGTTFFPAFSNFHLELGCLLFLEKGESYTHTDAAYQQVVNNFGPDDFNSIKQLAYSGEANLKLQELIALFRLSAYDSTIFIRFLSRLKQLAKELTHHERERLLQTIDEVWNMYFYIDEPFDLAYELGGMLYDLGDYTKALAYFQNSVTIFGQKADNYYNQAMCYYQLRLDKLFYGAVSEGKKEFPDSVLFEKLDGLDMG